MLLQAVQLFSYFLYFANMYSIYPSTNVFDLFFAINSPDSFLQNSSVKACLQEVFIMYRCTIVASLLLLNGNVPVGCGSFEISTKLGCFGEGLVV